MAKAPKSFGDFGSQEEAGPGSRGPRWGTVGAPHTPEPALPSGKGADPAEVSRGSYFPPQVLGPPAHPQQPQLPWSLNPKAANTALRFSSLLPGPGGQARLFRKEPQ